MTVIVELTYIPQCSKLRPPPRHEAGCTSNMTDGQLIDKRDLQAYALGLKGQIGPYAAQYARTRAQALLTCGDAEGHAIWLELAAMIDPGRTEAA